MTDDQIEIVWLKVNVESKRHALKESIGAIEALVKRLPKKRTAKLRKDAMQFIEYLEYEISK